MSDDRKEREELLKLYENLRVTDVRDGMDWVGYHGYGTVHHSIRPLWRTRAVGIAKTARYLPYEGPVPRVTGDEYTEWVRWYYREVCNDPWGEEIREGDFVVLDICGLDVGLLGSNNTLAFKLKGARGFLTNGGGIRDTDEVIRQRIPVWSKFVSQGMDQTRIRYYEKDIPVAIGGVAVYPGDVVVADGDGVIVVPRKIAFEVAKYAHQELKADKEARRRYYLQLGWELDETVL
ncbi:MAG: dimethylmenaquinone methyltransferase [Thermobacillus sp. ZCTH02-B1]|uniref:RraA family protein n=1 Tax=Thermobacillus sp. ZCTH02-B1 TaxID=1858795 RepID=UPI000B55A0B5|nr:RraA family protein [Thermobacillus sp. ZCTH02-B1]OUM95741.1 MAG: dimethylmenaquinone methyltransferase [Thermobacillus sp. ZCTH02-B1]